MTRFTKLGDMYSPCPKCKKYYCDCSKIKCGCGKRVWPGELSILDGIGLPGEHCHNCTQRYLKKLRSAAYRDPEQAWFWTDEWQAGEREVEEDLKHGRYTDYDNIDDFIDSLFV